jgi:DNA-binding NtrC family response regulator
VREQSGVARIWIVSGDLVLRETLAVHLVALGEVRCGPPERSAWKDEPAPDLVVLAGEESARGDLAPLERQLGFLRTVERRRRAAPPVLYVEPPTGHPSGELVAALVDDRPVAREAWPIDPDRTVALAASLLDAPVLPLSLRERARREWVTQRVERLYAGLDLPALRHAIDPRNAARPVLLIGQPGSECGLLARYIHNLAEPPRDALLVLPAVALAAGGVESRVLALAGARRVSVYLDDLDLAPAAAQEELAHALAESGLLGIEPLRWIASARRADRVAIGLRSLAWIRVELPPLHARPDLRELAQSMLDALAAARGRRAVLTPSALERLSRYAWPGNLRELEAVLDAALAAGAGEAIEADALRIPPRTDVRSEAPGRPEAEPAREPVAVEAEPAPIAPPAEALAPEEALARPEAPFPTPPESAPPTPAVGADARTRGPGLVDVAAPLAEELRQPLLALRTCALLLEQQPDDANVRRDLGRRVGDDLEWIEQTLLRLERFAALGPPKREQVDLAGLVAAELSRLRPRMRERSLVILEELDATAPPVIADAAQLRFAVEGLLDRALRMVPAGGDLYVGSFLHPARDGEPSRHRLLIRFHSPEEVLVAPDDAPGPPAPLEVIFARALVERMGGRFAVDASGLQENLVVIELET